MISVAGRIQVTSPAPRDIWNDLLNSDNNALVFQTPEWTDVQCAEGVQTDASRLYEAADGRKWMLPLVRKAPAIDLFSMQQSVPNGGAVGGIISNKPLTSQEIRTTFEDLRRQPALQTVVKPNPLENPLWEDGKINGVRTAPRQTHILDLAGGFERVWSQQFPSATRNKLRKAENLGASVEMDTSGRLVPTFYDIYMRWEERRAGERHLPALLARWIGRQREPLALYQRMADLLGESCQIWVASVRGEPIAAAFLLIYKCHAFYWRSASIKELASPVRANELLQLMMIRQACQAGCRYYHMGESGGVASLMHFKSRFGAVPTPYQVYALERLPLTAIQSHLKGIEKEIEQKLLQTQ